ncbi:astacin [Necator americanus]|uniref:Metalloendopeptidase n=1 Tax=Necator americanus TaxID=51031 RepID=W2TEY8_NECAM|nr:astacin [Necator americanus]ETN80164.1 astacin [Necator americanus]
MEEVRCVIKEKGGVCHSLLQRFGRSALPPDSPYKWDKYQDESGNYVIPYVISGDYSPEEKKEIFAAMEKISKNTCVAFRSRSAEEDYVEIANIKCSAYVGRFGGVSLLRLENGKYGCMGKRTIMQMLLHTVGLYHEHRRPDRDNFIKVHKENAIQDLSTHFQFAKLDPADVSTYNLPYDYTSIMHVGKDHYAESGKTTIETLDPAFQSGAAFLHVQTPDLHIYYSEEFTPTSTEGRKQEVQDVEYVEDV